MFTNTEKNNVPPDNLTLFSAPDPMEAQKVPYDSNIHDIKPKSKLNDDDVEEDFVDFMNEENEEEHLVNSKVHKNMDNVSVFVHHGESKIALMEIPKFIKVTNRNNVNLSPEDEIFFSTLQTGTTVMIRGLEYHDCYICDINEVIVNSKTIINLKLTWNASEAGVKREPFIVDIQKVQFLKELGRCEDTNHHSL